MERYTEYILGTSPRIKMILKPATDQQNYSSAMFSFEVWFLFPDCVSDW